MSWASFATGNVNTQPSVEDRKDEWMDIQNGEGHAAGEQVQTELLSVEGMCSDTNRIQRVLASVEEGVARDRDAQKKLKIHQVLVDVLLDSVDVVATVANAGLGQTQVNAQREKVQRMEIRMEEVMKLADEAYGEEEGYSEEGKDIVARMSRVYDRVRKTKVVVNAAAAKRRFFSGVDRREEVGRVKLTERVAKSTKFVRQIEKKEVIDLESESDEQETDEEMESVEVVEDSESSDEDEEEEIDSQEDDDQIPE